MIKKRGDDFKMGPKYIEIYDLVQASPDEYLMHHGIKNQKWGVRRGPPYPLESGSKTKVKKGSKASADRKPSSASVGRSTKKESISKQQISQMSDEELRRRIERLRLENAYAQEYAYSRRGEDYLKRYAETLGSLAVAGSNIEKLIRIGGKVIKLLI